MRSRSDKDGERTLVSDRKPTAGRLKRVYWFTATVGNPCDNAIECTNLSFCDRKTIPFDNDNVDRF
jgi:hypothetical protein